MAAQHEPASTQQVVITFHIKMLLLLFVVCATMSTAMYGADTMPSVFAMTLSRVIFHIQFFFFF